MFPNLVVSLQKSFCEQGELNTAHPLTAGAENTFSQFLSACKPVEGLNKKLQNEQPSPTVLY